jgi:hypothetical protein
MHDCNFGWIDVDPTEAKYFYLGKTLADSICLREGSEVFRAALAQSDKVQLWTKSACSLGKNVLPVASWAGMIEHGPLNPGRR